MNCHSPAAPTFEYAATLNDDSTCGNAAISGGTPCCDKVRAMGFSHTAARIKPSRNRSAWPNWKRILAMASRKSAESLYRQKREECGARAPSDHRGAVGEPAK